MRGNRDVGQGYQVKGGPIPACAGQPKVPQAIKLQNGAYPRVCGATVSFAAFLALRKGLSPRVRGNLQLAMTPKLQ